MHVVGEQDGSHGPQSVMDVGRISTMGGGV